MRWPRGSRWCGCEPDPQQQDLRQGQASVRLAEAEAAAARARLAELEASASRTHKLAEQAMVSALEAETEAAQVAAGQAAVKQAQARVDEARASVGMRRSSLDKTVVRSPIAGRVGRREAEQGMLVTPATVLFIVGDLDRVIVDVPLTEKMLGQVRPGQPVALRGPAWGRARPATLSRISPFLAAGSFSTTGEIDVDNRDGRLLPGMFVTADIATGESAGHPGPHQRAVGRPAVSPIGQASHRLASAARSRRGNSCLLCLQILPSFQPVALFAGAKFTPIGIFAGLWDGIELENTPA